jgi:Na+/melibiose symporter-like transporter
LASAQHRRRAYSFLLLDSGLAPDNQGSREEERDPIHRKNYQDRVQLKFTQKLKGLSQRQRHTFATVCAAGFFNNYDGALLSLAIEQIQRALRISESMLPRAASVITLGSLFAPLITSQADRRGRRTLLITTIALFSLLSGLTAFAWNAPSFVVLKFLTVIFSAAEGSIAMVMLVEEVNADARGLAVGMLGQSARAVSVSRRWASQ